MRKLGLAACLLALATNAHALQIADGQYAGSYNDIDLGAAQVAFNGITAKGSGGGAPLGSVIIWTEAENPEDMENWHDCDGGDITGSQLCTERHICTAPNFSGRFLRQRGGLNGGEVGNMQGDAIRNIEATFNALVNQGGYSGCVWPKRGFSACVGCSSISPWYLTYEFDASRVVPTTKDEANPENRPISYTVRYLIRINE